MSVSKHNDEIYRNLICWREKALLRKIYKNFYELIAGHLANGLDSYTVELGSGIGKIKESIPDCITTDLFPNQWVERVENAYKLTFADNSVSNLILFDMFHHLRYPGTALDEFYRVLTPHGRVIIFDPCMSMLGIVVFGLFHPEDLGLGEEIQMFAPREWTYDDNYYAAQGNASRLFWGKKYSSYLERWNILFKQKYSAISYVASGGYSKPQFYPERIFPLMKVIDRVCDVVPLLFATRLLVVLEKK